MHLRIGLDSGLKRLSVIFLSASVLSAPCWLAQLPSGPGTDFDRGVAVEVGTPANRSGRNCCS